jgi:hypothetical protein
MKDYHINVFCSEEDEGYIADIPDLEACSAFGSTSEEALREVNAAKASPFLRLSTDPQSTRSHRKAAKADS